MFNLYDYAHLKVKVRVKETATDTPVEFKLVTLLLENFEYYSLQLKPIYIYIYTI